MVKLVLPYNQIERSDFNGYNKSPHHLLCATNNLIFFMKMITALVNIIISFYRQFFVLSGFDRNGLVLLKSGITVEVLVLRTNTAVPEKKKDTCQQYSSARDFQS